VLSKTFNFQKYWNQGLKHQKSSRDTLSTTVPPFLKSYMNDLSTSLFKPNCMTKVNFFKIKLTFLIFSTIKNNNINRMGPRKTNKSEPSSSSESASGRQDFDYLAKRARNNEAVKRSREKAREKAKETSDKVIRDHS